jgi:hypothetical protein
VTKPYWDVWLTCMTNTCVTFISCIETVAADSGPEAGALAMGHLLEHGCQITLMHGSPKLPIKVISACPFKIEPSPPKVQISNSIPKEHVA